MPLERELKFSVLDPYVPSLSELRAALTATPFDAEPAPLQAIEDRYYDDDAGSLRSAGVALRSRRVDGRRFATLKAAGSVEGAMHRRDELELPLDDGVGAPPAGAPGPGAPAAGASPAGAREGAVGDGGGWPGPVLERLRGRVDHGTLAPRIELATSRVRFLLERDGRRVAELSFDAVAARIPGGERSVHFDEVEIEGAAGASRADLEAIAEAVDGIVRLTPNPVNKLERAAALLDLATW